MKLNRKRPFGKVQPPYKGAHFCQDGYYFTHEGRLVEGLGKAKGGKPREPDLIDDSEAMTRHPPAEKPEPVKEEASAPEGGFSFDAPFFTLQKEVHEATGTKPANKAEALQILADNDLI